GVYVKRGLYNVIGVAGAGNVISDNGGADHKNTSNGVRVSGGNTTSTSIQANKIGTNATAKKARPNVGNAGLVEGSASKTLIGGDKPDEENWIGGNAEDAIDDTAGENNRRKKNKIGKDALGAALPNGTGGIRTAGLDSLTEQNDIWFNQGPGVVV